MAVKKTTKETNTFSYLGVPGLTTSGTFDNSLYTPTTAGRSPSTPPPAVPSTPLPVTPSPTVTVPTIPTTPAPSPPAGSVNYLGVQGLNPTGTFGSQSVATKETSVETRNAFALIKETLALYGLEDLASTVEQFMKEGVPAQEGLFRLKTDTTKNPVTGKPYNEPYVTRFAGNEARRQAGLNVYSEAEYLASEDSFAQSLRAYGQADFFGKTKQEKRAEAAKFIGGNVSAKEFDDVLNLVVNEVKNKDPYTKAAMKTLYGIEEADLVKYFLNPEKNLSDLQQKAQAAQIGGAALMQGTDAAGKNLLGIDNAMSLAKLGVTQEQAQVGYGKIAEVLPTTEKLSKIYGEENIAYTQKTAEEETFQNLASAKRKRMQLAQKEIGSFSGSSGMGKGALSSPISI